MTRKALLNALSARIGRGLDEADALVPMLRAEYDAYAGGYATRDCRSCRHGLWVIHLLAKVGGVGTDGIPCAYEPSDPDCLFCHRLIALSFLPPKPKDGEPVLHPFGDSRIPMRESEMKAFGARCREGLENWRMRERMSEAAANGGIAK